MNRIFTALIVIVALMLCSCSLIASDSSRKVEAPQNRKIPIAGKWQVEKYFDTGTKDENEDLVGKIVQFSKDIVLIEGTIFRGPAYRTKKVDAGEYMFYKHKSYPVDYGMKEGEVQVITVISGNSYLCELIKVSENEAIGEIQNSMVLIRKISDSIDNYSLKSSFSEQSAIPWEEVKNTTENTGVFIGLRSAFLEGNSDDGNINYSYRTLWVESKRKVLQPVYETSGIFFPRRSGFWRLEAKRSQEGGMVRDTIYAYDAFGKPEIDTPLSAYENKSGKLLKSILYVCNDYIYQLKHMVRAGLQIIPIPGRKTH
jgi:hypothetical protein